MPVEPAEANGQALDATVITAATSEELRAELIRRGELPLDAQAQRERYAQEAEAAVETIEGKLESTKEALKTAKDEAKRLRREANQGGEG